MARYKGTFVLESEPTTTSVVLTWEAPKGPTPVYYDITRDGTALVTRVKWALTRTDSAVVAGQVYTYRVRAYGSFSSEGEALSNPAQVTVTPVPVPLTSPALTGTVGATQCSLSWTAVANADTYQLQRKTGAGGTYANATTPSNVLSFVNTGLTNATEYFFRVRGTANSAAYLGPWSNELPLTPAAAAPEAPTLTGTPGNAQNSLDWNSVSGAATYRIRFAVNAPVSGTESKFLFETAETDYIHDGLVNGADYQYNVRGVTAGLVLGSFSNPLDLTPLDTLGGGEPPEEPAIVGYAAQAGVSGGGTVAATEVSTWAGLKAALLASGPRRITFAPGTGYIDGGGETLKIQNNNLTLDGTGWAKALRKCFLILEASNVIITQMRLWVTDQVNSPADADALTINPGFGSSLSKVVIDHCSLLWAPDVTLAILNNSWNVTVQHSILGAGLYRSAHPEANDPGEQHSYGPNIATLGANPDPANEYPRGITFYRNYLPHNDGRNMRGQGAAGIEYINNVVYNWGGDIAHMNPRGANVVGNMFKKGPDTPATNEVLRIDTDKAYPAAFNNSIYWTDNIGITAVGGSFTPTLNFSVGPDSRRTTSGPWGGGLHNVSAAPASSTLAAAVVAAAGPSQANAIDTALKGHFTNGNGSFYNGAGFAAPNPSWP